MADLVSLRVRTSRCATSIYFEILKNAKFRINDLIKTIVTMPTIPLKFSVMMCVYGGDDAEPFREALTSVYDQTCVPDEVVLVVDGPVPSEIDAVINDFERSQNLCVYRLLQNMGHGIARKNALAHCSNDIVAIADADDINVRTRFEKQLVEFKKNPNLSAVSSNTLYFVGSLDNVIKKETLPTKDEEIKRYMKTRCPLCNAATMLRKSEVEKAGGYLDLYCCEDYYLWVRMALVGAMFTNVNEFLVYVRSSEAQIRRRGGWKYFCSMKTLFDFMLKNKIIDLPTYLFNMSTRFVLQVVLPTDLRAVVRKLAR